MLRLKEYIYNNNKITRILIVVCTCVFINNIINDALKATVSIILAFGISIITSRYAKRNLKLIGKWISKNFETIMFCILAIINGIFLGVMIIVKYVFHASYISELLIYIESIFIMFFIRDKFLISELVVYLHFFEKFLLWAKRK